MGDADLHYRLGLLSADYASRIDADELEAWPGFFHEECLYKITTADNHRRGWEAGIVYADSRAMLHDRVAALREANIYERQSYRHVVGQPTRVVAEGDETTAETPFLVVRIMRNGAMDLFAGGRYVDRVRPDADGALRFVERIVVCDGARFDTLVAIPL
jgi:anthranilate 1,2-dioxygenase small subunit/terephthalate 1,2-dioxygenase oxygenase component beta subunit